MMQLDSFSTIAALNAAVANVDKLPGVSKRVYYCQRCLNHDRLEPRKNHKCECAFSSCTCPKCILVEKRRVLNTQLHELEEVTESMDEGQNIEKEEQKPAIMRAKGERVPNCQKCGQHGRKSRLKGHKRVCPFKDCQCPKCQVVSERQKLMADQIKIRRRQRKDTLMNMTRENITATLNAAAAVAAAGQAANFNLGGFNALLYNQLKPQQLLPTTPTQPTTDFSSLPMLSSHNDLLKSSLLFPSPVSLLTPSPSNPTTPSTPPSSIVAPVPINPSAFSFPLMTSNEQLFQSLLSNFKLLNAVKEENLAMSASLVATTASAASSSSDPSTLIDVCSV